MKRTLIYVSHTISGILRRITVYRVEWPEQSDEQQVSSLESRVSRFSSWLAAVFLRLNMAPELFGGAVGGLARGSVAPAPLNVTRKVSCQNRALPLAVGSFCRAL